MLGDSSYSGTVEHEICEKPIVPVVVVVMNFILYRQQLLPMLKTTLNTLLFATEPNNQKVELLILGISALASDTKY